MKFDPKMREIIFTESEGNNNRYDMSDLHYPKISHKDNISR
jgi:hypothetical protein